MQRVLHVVRTSKVDVDVNLFTEDARVACAVVSKSVSLKWEKKSCEMCTQYFYMWTLIMQSLNKKEWYLLKLQITQTRFPKNVADVKMDRVDLLLDLLSLKRRR